MLVTYHVLVVEEGFFKLVHPSTALTIEYTKHGIQRIL